jgi:hypothetical protein
LVVVCGSTLATAAAKARLGLCKTAQLGRSLILAAQELRQIAKPTRQTAFERQKCAMSVTQRRAHKTKSLEIPGLMKSAAPPSCGDMRCWGFLVIEAKARPQGAIGGSSRA